MWSVSGPSGRGELIDIGLSDIYAMVGQDSPFGQVGLSRIPVGIAGLDIPLLEELTAQENFRSDQDIIRATLQKLDRMIFLS